MGRKHEAAVWMGMEMKGEPESGSGEETAEGRTDDSLSKIGETGPPPNVRIPRLADLRRRAEGLSERAEREARRANPTSRETSKDWGTAA